MSEADNNAEAATTMGVIEIYTVDTAVEPVASEDKTLVIVTKEEAAHAEKPHDQLKD